MSTSAIAVHFDRENMFVDLADGRRLSVPLTWFPRLLHANPEARERVAISHAGLHWDEIDEDISVEGLLAGRGDQTSKERNIEYAAPKAFISHATEDKAIVVPFATSLRSKGVDAWVDQWEIRPGDSLVQKIFEEGIGGTAAVIVVLSKTSVTKKWVKEELDAAVIGRINQTSRLIPFLIEDCEVPVALRATKWVHLHNDLNSAVDEVVHALHGTSGKPPLGHAPPYVRNSLPTVQGITSIDTLVLFTIGEIYLSSSRVIQKDEILKHTTKLELKQNQVEEALEILSENYLITAQHAIGHTFVLVRLASGGAEAFFRHKFPDFDTYYRDISADLVNDRHRNNEDIARHHSLPLVLVDHIFDDLETQGLIKMSKSISGSRHVYDVSARLKRLLQ